MSPQTPNNNLGESPKLAHAGQLSVTPETFSDPRQSALAEIELAVNRYYDLQHLLDRITASVTELLPASGGASVILWDESAKEFYVSSSSVAGQPEQMTARRVRREGGATRWIVDHREPLIVSDIRQDPFTANRMLPEYALQAYAGFPLLIDGQAIGVLYALDTYVRHYTEADIQFLTALANRAATMIHKVRTHEQLHATNAQLARESQEKATLILELQEALANIRTLRGLLPICANCKNIRNDEGFWQQVEVYVSEHSGAQFSHSICPECIKKLYPGYGQSFAR